MFSSPLRRAIARGMKPGGDLTDELNDLEDYSIQSKKDAKAICEALSTLPVESSEYKGRLSSPLHALTSLFQDVDGPDAPAFEVLYHEGLPELIRIFDAIVADGGDEDIDDLLFVLKILAMYGAPEGAEKIIEAARLPLNNDAYLWHVILSAFSPGHPQRDFVFRALSDPLPDGFLAIALLDSANNSAIEGDLDEHPFDSEVGRQKLQEWLEDANPDHASYAHSATAALPFISNPDRDQLLALAMEHADRGVQLEAAWAAGKLNRESGLKVLARYCLDVNHSDVAQRYLTDLNREDLIPKEAEDATFSAKADFARWLAHPNELGTPPDELEVVDHRLLNWPPERDAHPFWLIRYRLRDRTGLEEDDVDCGLVGSATWCFFTYKMHMRPPEDAYAIHCYWEMEHADLIHESEVTDSSEYAGLLGQWRGEPLEDAAISRVVEVSPKLNIASRFVALASAKLQGQEGWVVLDGARSAWYPQDEQPPDNYESVILKVHVGRQLLGFEGDPDRKAYLVPEPSTRTPQRTIDAYENLLAEAAQATAEDQEDLLGSRSLLMRHFEDYIDALVESNGEDRPDTVIRIYESLLKLAAEADASIHESLYDCFSVLGEHFEIYVDALIASDRSADVIQLIRKFEPYWDHNLGYGKLGAAAFAANDRSVAEPFLLRLREGLDCYHRSEGMSMLAEIWCERGEEGPARELLSDCLQKIKADIEESPYNSDRKIFADEFRHHRATYLRLFPDGEQELAELGIPDEPL